MSKLVGYFCLLMMVIGSAFGATLNMSLLGVYSDSSGAGTVDNVFFFAVQPPYLYAHSSEDSTFTILNISTPGSFSLIGNITDSSVPYSLEYGRNFQVDNTKNVVYASSLGDSALTIINISDKVRPSFTGMGYTASQVNNPYSINATYGEVAFKVGTDTFLIAGAKGTQTVSVFNATNVNAVIKNHTYRTTWSGIPSCSTDDVRYFAVDNERGIVFMASYGDDQVSFINTSQFPTTTSNFTCFNDYQRSTALGTLDGASQMYFDNETDILYVTAYLDNGWTALNTSNPTVSLDTAIVSTYYDYADNSSTYRIQDVRGYWKDGQHYVFVMSRGNMSAGYRAKISVFNASTWNATLIGVYQDNDAGGVCNHSTGEKLAIDEENEILYYSTSGDDCLYARKMFDDAETADHSCDDNCTISKPYYEAVLDEGVVTSYISHDRQWAHNVSNAAGDSWGKVNTTGGTLLTPNNVSTTCIKTASGDIDYVDCSNTAGGVTCWNNWTFYPHHPKVTTSCDAPFNTYFYVYNGTTGRNSISNGTNYLAAASSYTDSDSKLGLVVLNNTPYQTPADIIQQYVLAIAWNEAVGTDFDYVNSGDRTVVALFRGSPLAAGTVLTVDIGTPAMRLSPNNVSRDFKNDKDMGWDCSVDASYEGGNMGWAGCGATGHNLILEPMPDFYWDIDTSSDCGGAHFLKLLEQVDFTISDLDANQDYTFEIRGVQKYANLCQDLWSGSWTYWNATDAYPSHMKYSCDNVTWYQADDFSYDHTSWNYNFTINSGSCDQLRITTYYPYEYSKQVQYLEDNEGDYLTSTVIGYSRNGRPIYRTTVTNPDISEASKDHVYLLTRQHPAEAYGAFWLQGMMDYLTSANATAEAIRNSTTFYLLWNVNPDGSEYSLERSNGYENLNRDWSHQSSPEVSAAWDDIDALDDANGIDFFMDIHTRGHGGDETDLDVSDVEWMSCSGGDYGDWGKLIGAIESNVHDIPSYSSSSTCTGTGSSTSGTAPGYVAYWAQTMAATYEIGGHSTEWTPDLLKTTGRNMTLALYDYFSP